MDVCYGCLHRFGEGPQNGSCEEGEIEVAEAKLPDYLSTPLGDLVQVTRSENAGALVVHVEIPASLIAFGQADFPACAS